MDDMDDMTDPLDFRLNVATGRYERLCKKCDAVIPDNQYYCEKHKGVDDDEFRFTTRPSGGPAE